MTVRGQYIKIKMEEEVGAPALPSPSPAFPALSTLFPYPLPPLHTFLHPHPSTFHGTDPPRGCADDGGGSQRAELDAIRSSLPHKK